MSFLKSKRGKKIFIIALSVFAFFALLVGACAIYLGDYYKADAAAIEAFMPEGIAAREEDGNLVFAPEDAELGFIFYPGGKVEYTAYIPLMRALAERGILCVLVEMPFNLAVFDINAADGICEKFPEIESWYIGGHSLGGSMAASYLEKHTDGFCGLVLLGSYSAADLSKSTLSVLSLYGSEDGVMNAEKYEESKANLPEDFTEVIIDGGCHAYFGMYGAQDGDGTPSVTNSEQIIFTAEKIAEMICVG